VRFAQENSVDQLVIGTHGRGKVGKLLLGSVADKVLHFSDITVLMVN
jgi:nucleotide-binding universal stress UspA family protein